MSGNKEDWQNIAAAVRIALEKRIPDMAVMTPGELKEFIGALDAAETFEMMIDSQDERREHHARSLDKTWNDD